MSLRLVRFFTICFACLFAVTACSQQESNLQEMPAAVPSQDKSADYSPSSEAIRLIAENPVLEQIAGSYSAGKFVKGDIPDPAVEAILLSGSKAPSAKNAQPWHFTVISNAETMLKLHGQIAEGNVMIVISGKQNIATDTAEFDCGLAAAYMQLAAESMGYGARILISPIGAIEKQRKVFGIPDGYKVLAVILAGAVEQSADAVASATPRNPLPDMVNFAE